MGSVIVVALAAAAGGLQVQERRDAAAEERRLEGLLQLSVPAGSWRILWSAASLPTQSIEGEMRVLVRNDGPRAVNVTHASVGGFTLHLAMVPLAAQATVELVLQAKVECSAEAPPASDTFSSGPTLAPGPLEITAQTSRGIRTIKITQPPYHTEHAPFACSLLQNNPPPR